MANCPRYTYTVGAFWATYRAPTRLKHHPPKSLKGNIRKLSPKLQIVETDALFLGLPEVAVFGGKRVIRLQVFDKHRLAMRALSLLASSSDIRSAGNMMLQITVPAP